MNTECLVSISQQVILIRSLPLVHTARRCYRLNSKCEMGGLCDVMRVREERKTIECLYLEEAKVVKRFPYVNLRKDQ